MWSDAMPDRRLYLGDCLEGMASLADQSVDHCITDPPYSERCHTGVTTSRSDGGKLTVLGYDCLTPEDVDAFARQMVRVSRGWILVMTDHVLWPLWVKALGRYSFPPVPIVIKGMTVRLTGDGPSSWTIHLVVNRPNGFPPDGTKDGAYVGDPGSRADNPVKGHKPRWLMDRLIVDYTQPNQVILDPCMGSGQTGISALRYGRKFVGMEKDPETFAFASKRILSVTEQLMIPATVRPKAKQESLIK